MRTYTKTLWSITSTSLVLVMLSACDFKVTNPGPVQSPFLNDSTAAAIVNGAGRDLAESLNWIAYTGGAVAREIFPAGSTGSFGISAQQQVGKLLDDDTNDYWYRAQRARYEAETGSARLRESLKGNFAKDTLAAKILLWGGYSNRLLGENMCEAVFNGSAAMPNRAYLDSAEVYFTAALAIAQTANNTRMINAAYAGRASVRADLGNWTGAVADAANVPDTYVFQMPYFVTDIDQYNRIYWATANQPYRAHTVWNTFYEQYYATTKDPRVPWATDPNQAKGDAAVLNIGQVNWYKEMKFDKRESSINLSTGWEMRLLEAEAKLIAGDIPGAMTLINKHRLAINVTPALAPWAATTIDEAWTALKKERGIELWLEGRRLGDLRRWKALNRPGALSPYEQIGATSYLTQQDLCFPISLVEKQTNPNLTH